MSIVVFIPARYASSRFIGKALAPLCGPDGSKPLVQRTYEVALKLQQSVADISAVYVLTDDARIEKCVHEFGGDVILTSETCANGTARCAEACDILSDPSVQMVVNLQGDAPLTPVGFMQQLIAALQQSPSLSVATPMIRCDRQTYERLAQDRRAGRVGATTVVCDRHSRALYFSKQIIPYVSEQTHRASTPLPIWHHVGVYAYRPAALSEYSSWGVGTLEANEGLEQLRFLENQVPVLCVEVALERENQVFWELNNPEDVACIEASLMHHHVD